MELFIGFLIVTIGYLLAKNSELKRDNAFLRLAQIRNKNKQELEHNETKPSKTNELPDNVLQFKPRKKDDLEDVLFIG